MFLYQEKFAFQKPNWHVICLKKKLHFELCFTRVSHGGHWLGERTFHMRGTEISGVTVNHIECCSRHSWMNQSFLHILNTEQGSDAQFSWLPE